MSHSKMTVAIKGGYGHGNFGDDALMLAAYEISKRIFDSESYVFICRDANYISKILPDAKVVQQDDMLARSADVLVYGGGTQFYSFPLTSSPRGIFGLFTRLARNARRPFQLSQKILQKMRESIYNTLNQRVIAVGIGLGPFNENCRIMHKTKELFTGMDYIAVRDHYSYNLCKEWGLKNVSFRADLCYLSDFWKVRLPEVSEHRNRKIKIRKIGIIPRDWPHTKEGDAYKDSLFQVVRELNNEGKKVEFISFAKDIEWARRLKNKGERLITWNPEKNSISEFIEKLSGYDAFITARYHGAVFASILRKPVVCIDVEQKLRLVADLFGAGARLWSFPFNTLDCLKHISKLENGYQLGVAYLAHVVKEQRALVDKMIDEEVERLRVTSC
jgi:polysaccharide pyruvyl transferase WcaK-like protein